MYCHNNLIRYIDPDGHKTIGYGFFGDIGAIDKGFAVNIQLLKDNNSNYGFSVSYTENIYTTPSVNAHIGSEVSTATTIYETSGSASSISAGFGGKMLSATAELSSLDGNGYALRLSNGVGFFGIKKWISASGSTSQTTVGGINTNTLLNNISNVKANLFDKNKSFSQMFDNTQNPFGLKNNGANFGWSNNNKGINSDNSIKLNNFLDGNYKVAEKAMNSFVSEMVYDVHDYVKPYID